MPGSGAMAEYQSAMCHYLPQAQEPPEWGGGTQACSSQGQRKLDFSATAAVLYLLLPSGDHLLLLLEIAPFIALFGPWRKWVGCFGGKLSTVYPQPSTCSVQALQQLQKGT